MSHRSVRVALLGINYTPEPTGIAPYTAGIATGLAQRGHDVQVLTGYPHYPQWRRDGRTSGFRTEQQVDLVRVRRFNHFVPGSGSWIGRAAMELTFGLQLLTTRWGQPDVVVCVTPPLLAGAMSVLRARLTPGRPAVGILVQDLYGRGAAETKAVSGASARVLSGIESAALRLSDGVAVIHAGFADLVEPLGVDRRRIRELRNWTHVGSTDLAAGKAFRRAHRWGADEVVVLHAGNMGYKQGLENVIAAAQLAARTGSQTRFVLLGDGNQRRQLEAAGAGVSTLEFLRPVTTEEFPAALKAADVLLVNERPGVAQMAVPSKLTSYFTSGKPILAATDLLGFTAGELTASGAGVCVPANRPDLLLTEARRLGTDTALADQLGEAGRRYCNEVLSKEAALDRYEEWILDLASCGRPRGRND
jgi:colanic acid biosynthesis glycosyl transferase WcaI